jgi:hypothetical protein
MDAGNMPQPDTEADNPFPLNYETPPFLNGSEPEVRAEFRRLWEHGVRILSNQQLQTAIDAWVRRLQKKDHHIQAGTTLYVIMIQELLCRRPIWPTDKTSPSTHAK